jgi:hypothetical protein
MLRRTILLAVPSLGLLASVGCDWTSLLYGFGAAGGVLNFYNFFATLFGV